LNRVIRFGRIAFIVHVNTAGVGMQAHLRNQMGKRKKIICTVILKENKDSKSCSKHE